MSTAFESPAPAARASTVVRDRRTDRMFFAAMAVAILATVFVGFAPTYYLKGLFGAPALSPLLHAHGVVFTAWILLFVVQVSLVAAKRTDRHRRLGVAGGILAALMLGVGAMVAIDAARRGFTPPGGPPPLSFLIIPLGDLVVFGALVAAALYSRRRSEAHKRLMLLATIGLLTPAIARMPAVAAGGILGFYALTDLFAIVCLVYDRVAHRRVHPALVKGSLFLIASQPARLFLGGTATWLAFAGWLTR